MAMGFGEIFAGRNVILIITAFSILGLYFLSRIIIRPFQKILQGVHAISSGDLNATIDMEGSNATVEPTYTAGEIMQSVSLNQQASWRWVVPPEEGFVLSRINGQWDIRSILKLCPMPNEETLLIFSRLLDRQVIELR